MVELWFALLCFMLTMFVVLDGWDFGAGALHLIVAKHARRAPAGDRRDRAAVELARGLAGRRRRDLRAGVSASRWPSRSPASTWRSGWCSGRLSCAASRSRSADTSHDSLWRSAWDFVFAVSNLMLAMLFGAALGNVIRGVPLDASGEFSMPLFTDFSARGRVGILDWYTLSVAVFATVLLAAHGATYLRLKTVGPVHERSERLARLAVGGGCRAVRPSSRSRPGSSGRSSIGDAPASSGLARSAVIAAVSGRSGPGCGERPKRGRLPAPADVAGLLGGAAASVFPVFLHSTLAPEHSLTAYSGATARTASPSPSSGGRLPSGLACTYFVVIMRSYAARCGRHTIRRVSTDAGSLLLLLGGRVEPVGHGA